MRGGGASRSFDSLELDGLHVFRYSERPGTPATRKAGRVPESVRKERAAELLALAGRARARRAAARIGGTAVVLFETRLPDGRWTGHAEDDVRVVAASADGRPLDNVIAPVRIVAIDPDQSDVVVGRLEPGPNGADRAPRGSPMLQVLREDHAR